jgi:hypothetical protein
MYLNPCLLVANPNIKGVWILRTKTKVTKV